MVPKKTRIRERARRVSVREVIPQCSVVRGRHRASPEKGRQLGYHVCAQKHIPAQIEVVWNHRSLEYLHHGHHCG